VDKDADDTTFWSALPPRHSKEKVLKKITVRSVPKEGFHKGDYFSKTDVEFMKKELKLLKKK
jgi:hypothetical protein